MNKYKVGDILLQFKHKYPHTDEAFKTIRIVKIDLYYYWEVLDEKTKKFVNYGNNSEFKYIEEFWTLAPKTMHILYGQ